MNGAGNALLAIAAVASLAGLVLPLLGRAWGRPVLVRAGMGALYAVLAVTLVDTLVLLGGFLTRDFGNLYVYEHSSRALSWVYTVSALWAGNAGSLLLWLLLMALFAVIAARGGRKRDPGSVSYLVPVLSLMNLFFSLLVLFGPQLQPVCRQPPGRRLRPTGWGSTPCCRTQGWSSTRSRSTSVTWRWPCPSP